MKKIGCMGIGFVGGALKELLETKYSVNSYDKFKEPYNTKEHLEKALDSDVIFLCVPTLFDWKLMDYYYSAIEDCLSQIPDDKIVVIKSTVQPGTCEKMSEKRGHKIVFNPEFLREVTAVEDMKNADRTVLGGDITNCEVICDIYKALYPFEMKYIFTTWEIAELTKIATNSFLASKVSFCNEIEEYCNRKDISYDAFREVWLADKRIGRGHTQVTDKGGFSGTCFPKDINALITSMKKVGMDPIFHRATWNTNCQYREEFSDEKYKR